MSSTPTRCIALTKELEAYILARVGSGHYTSASEVVRAALRLMIERDENRAGFGSLAKPPTPPPALAERAP